jgi:hypothetical protein
MIKDIFMKIHLFLITLITFHSAYLLSADEHSPSTPNQQTTPPDTVQQKHYGSIMFGTFLGGISGGFINGLLSNPCAHTFPFNATASTLSCVGNIVVDATANIGGGAALGIVTGCILIGAYKLTKHCCGKQKIEKAIA